MADVVNMLRRRPSVLQNGLLWKLQASLHETVLEQERLQRCAGWEIFASAAQGSWMVGSVGEGRAERMGGEPVMLCRVMKGKACLR